ncbi:hypothetical protein DEJ25_04635 [Curtobacterium sp. MCPF17_011]|uniref:hypothetical protein n=1 Tax=Curtobacterium sp. MCPF17_011 TaxID=2175652 RepID=UPI000DA8E8A0|nr:hypothetical protein [Curtobacterium sp. MCPF17_011]PZF13782.1 hypothetical protein DEJ25_04635 [Curtobacterium sp. MCPF17_011]
MVVEALGAVAAGSRSTADLPGDASPLRAFVAVWAERSGLADVDVEVLALALLTWTRLHGIISPEIGGHLLLLRPSLLQTVAADPVEVTGYAGRFALDAVTTWIGQEIDGCQRSAGTSNSEDRFGAAALVTLSGDALLLQEPLDRFDVGSGIRPRVARGDDEVGDTAATEAAGAPTESWSAVDRPTVADRLGGVVDEFRGVRVRLLTLGSHFAGVRLARVTATTRGPAGTR